MLSSKSVAWRGWASVLGGALINMSCGVLYCFGNLTPYIVSYIRKHGRESNLTYQIAIVFTGILFATNAVGSVIGSQIERRLGVRRAILCGCLVNWFGTVTSYGAVQFSFYLFVVTYGVVFGIGAGWLFYPTLISGMRWFPKKRGLVCGVLMSFFGVGAWLYEYVQTLFINPTNLSPNDIELVGNRQETYYTQESVLRKTPFVFLLQAGISVILQIIGLLLQSEPEDYHNDTEMQALLDRDEKESSIWDDTIEMESLPDQIEHVEDTARNIPHLTSGGKESRRMGRDGSRTPSGTQQQGVVIGDGLESSRLDPLWSGRSLSVGEVIREPGNWLFMSMCAACLFTGLAFLGSFKAFGLGFIRDDLFLAMTGSVGAVCNCIGHVMSGILVDHISTKVTAILLTALMSFSLLVVSATSLGGKAPFFITVCGVFFTVGGMFAILPVFTIRAYGEKHFADNYSLILIGGVCVPNTLGILMVFVQPFLSWTTMYLCFGIISGLSMIAGMFMNVKNKEGHDV